MFFPLTGKTATATTTTFTLPDFKMKSEIPYNRTLDNRAEIFFARLKKETADMHKRLENHPLSRALMHPQLSTQDYVIYLKKMGSVMSFCEMNIFPAVQHIVPDLHERKKTQLIKDDLEYFSAEKEPATNNYEPFNKTSLPFALGYLYVIEGSTLGGRIILKHIQTRLDIDGERGGSFFAGYKEGTSIKWKNLLQNLSDYILDNRCEEETIAGAKNAFSTIYDHFGT